MNLNSMVDLTFLPDITDDDIFGVTVLHGLEDAYKLAVEGNYRGFCTYSYLLGDLNHKKQSPILSAVVSFPEGDDSIGHKCFSLGRLCELGRLNSFPKLEADLVLSKYGGWWDSGAIERELLMLGELCKLIPVKLILEIEERTKDDIKHILNYIEHHDLKFKYIKSSTGRTKTPILLEEKLALCHWMSGFTSIPQKVAGGIRTIDAAHKIIDTLGPKTILGVSWKTIQQWDYKGN